MLQREEPPQRSPGNKIGESALNTARSQEHRATSQHTSPPSVPQAQPLRLISELQPPPPCCQPELGGERTLTLKPSPELVSNSEETSCFSVEILSATSSDQWIVCYSTMSRKILLGSELPSRPVTLTLGCTLESLGISKMKNAKAGATETELPEMGPRNVS